MKNPTNKRKFIIFGVFGLLFLSCVSLLIYTVMYNDVSDSTVIVPEYNDLFIKDAQSKLHLIGTEKSRNREIISSYRYDKRFGIFVFKVILSDFSSLKKIISYRNESSHRPWFGLYTPLGGYQYDMNMYAGKSVPVYSVTFQTSGDSIKPIAKNDSFYCYYYKFNTFSIHYNNRPYDIVAKSNRSDIPASILFKKKGDFLYIILMTVEEGEEKMQPDLLYNIVNK